MATILSAASINLPLGLDSENLWPLLSEGGKSPRTDIILSLDQVYFYCFQNRQKITPKQDHEEGTWTAVLRRGKHKLIWGQEKLLLKEKNPEESCRQQLYNLRNDPLEEQDLMERGPNRKIASPMRQTLMDALKVCCQLD